MEGGPPVLAECDELAVDHGFGGELRQPFEDAGVAGGEVLIVSRTDAELAAAPERDGAIAVDLQLICPA